MVVMPSTDQFKYIATGIEAQGHTPVYKMHKYFARRPHNVFRHLIEAYTKQGDIVLDCFCGGGVTLFEGLAIGRKVIGVDLNPLATFVSDCQTTYVPLGEYGEILNAIWEDFRQLTSQHYSTRCRVCSKKAEVRWYELAYKVICTQCGETTLVSNENKYVNGSKVVNGQYVCTLCHQKYPAVEASRIGYELLSVTYRCSCTRGRQTVSPVENDFASMNTFENDFDNLIKEYDLWFPSDEIPATWDRQQEDCLHRKSVFRFTDFYTKRCLFFNAYLLKAFRNYKFQVSPDLYKMLLFTFSAIIRYTNNMTYSSGNWMDGRPNAWDKHAYWTPNQFVEVNPLEYLEKRRDAIISGLKFQQKTLKKSKPVDSYTELTLGEGSHIIWNRSSANLPLPDSSVQAVITDPPYGSNVQYGELSHYWLVWLQQDLALDGQLFNLDNEILVQRKNQHPGHKDYDQYFDGLLSVFRECYRVLEEGGVLVFTFNNKDIQAWYSVIKAAIKAGFFLDSKGIVYQEPIENYKNTAHTRFAGSLHGDFIYTFRKLGVNTTRQIAEVSNASQISELLRAEIEQYLLGIQQATTSDIYIHAMGVLIPYMASVAESDEEFARLNSEFDFDNLERFFRTHFAFSEITKLWTISD